MATRWAVASGNWSNTATWDGGTLPGLGDDVHADGKTVAIDQNINVGSIRSTQRSGGTVGGGFTVASAIDITLTGSQGTFPGTNAVALIVFSHTTGTATLTGVVMGGASANFVAVSITAAGNVNVIGPIGAATGLGASSVIVQATATGTYTFTGSVVGAASGSAAGLLISSASATVTVTGDVTGGVSGAGITTVGNITVIGNCTAGNGVNAYAVFINAATVLVHTGMAVASSLVGALHTANQSAVCISTGPFISSQSKSAVAFYSMKIAFATTTTYWEFPTGDGGTRRLYTADNVGGNPAEDDVREGVVYGPADELEGTLIVPDPANVASGVPTDNTVGTAALTPEEFWDYLLSGATVEGSAGQKLASIKTSVVVVS